MATPMTADQMVSQLRRWGVTVVEHAGWRTHNRNTMSPWGPINGSMVHHTASHDGPGITELCYTGRPDLPGPLCHGVIHKNGSVTMVGNGRVNHAGRGSSAVLEAVVKESALPTTGPDAVDGNTRFYGWECVNLGDGRDPWPNAQLETIARVQAALCEYHGWSAASVIGHREWTSRKVDPRGFTMGSLRERVRELLERGPGGDDMPTADEVATAVVNRLIASGGVLGNSDLDRIWSRDGTVDAARPPHANADYPSNPAWSAGYALQAAVEAAREAASRAEECQRALNQVLDALGQGTGPTDAQLIACAEAGAQAALRVLGDKLS